MSINMSRFGDSFNQLLPPPSQKQSFQSTWQAVKNFFSGSGVSNESSKPAPSAAEIRTKRADRLVERAMKGKALSPLCEKASSQRTKYSPSGGPWAIEFQDDQPRPWRVEFQEGYSQPASCDHILRQINLSSRFSDEVALNCLVFELANASNSEKFMEVIRQGRKGTLNREDFAMEMERIEYDSLCTYHETIGAVREEMGLEKDPKLELHVMSLASNFEKHWNLIKDTHANHYRRLWDGYHSDKSS